MWNGLFDVKRDFSIFQKSFQGSTLYNHLKELGFDASLSITNERKILLTFMDQEGQNVQISMEFDFEQFTIHLYSLSSFSLSSVHNELESLICEELFLLIEKSGSNFIIFSEMEDYFEGRDVIINERERKVAFPIGEKSKNLFQILKNFDLCFTDNWSPFRLNNFLFYQGVFYINWDLEENPHVKVFYSSFKDSQNFLLSKTNCLFKLYSEKDINKFHEWLSSLEKERHDVLLEIKDQLSSYESKISFADDHSLTIGESLVIEVKPDVLNYTFGYNLLSPSYLHSFFSSKEFLLKAVVADYHARKKKIHAYGKLKEILSKYGEFDFHPFSLNIVRLFGEELRFQIHYSIDRSFNTTYTFVFNKSKGDGEYSSTDINEVTEFALSELKKYMNSIKIRSLFKDTIELG